MVIPQGDRRHSNIRHQVRIHICSCFHVPGECAKISVGMESSLTPIQKKLTEYHRRSPSTHEQCHVFSGKRGWWTPRYDGYEARYGDENFNYYEYSTMYNISELPRTTLMIKRTFASARAAIRVRSSYRILVLVVE